MNKKLYMYFTVFLLWGMLINVTATNEEPVNEIPEIEDINEVDEAGVYYVPVYIYDEGIKAKKLIKVNVLFSKSNINEANKEGIDAYDFFVLPNTINSLTTKELVAKARAHAWNTETGEKVMISVALVSKASDGVGYDVTFKTDKGTSITVKAYESDNVNQNLITNYRDQNIFNDGLRKSYFLPRIFIQSLYFLPIILIIILYFGVRRKLVQTRELLYQKER